MIDEDADLLALKDRIQLDEERYQDFKRENKYRYLSSIKDHLSSKRKKEFEELENEFKDNIEDPDYRTYLSKEMVGPNSPFSKTELASLSTADLIAKLKIWKPKDDLKTLGSKQELGRVISDIVSGDPSKYFDDIEKFHELDEPIYIRNIFWGLQQALRHENSKNYFEWDKIINFASKIATKEDDLKHEPKDSAEFDVENWRAARSAIASLIYEGLTAKEPLKIPIKYESGVYNVISLLLADKDPTLEEDTRYSESNNYYSRAINTIRGKALENLIKYALWIREEVKNDNSEEFVISKGFQADDRLLKVKSMFETILKKEKSLIVLSVFGFWLPWLVMLDKKWCQDNKDFIFPQDEANADKRAVVWSTYIEYSQPYNMVYEVLADEYKYWVDNWELMKKGNEKAENSFRILQHLIQFYWRTKNKDNSEYWFELNGAADEFCFQYVFKKVPPIAIARLMNFVGRLLINENEDIPASTIVRLKEIWEYRFEATLQEPKKYNDELNAFVDWFVSDVFDDEWAFGIMNKVFSKIGYPKDDYRLFKYLKDKTVNGSEITDCIKLMIENTDIKNLRQLLFMNRHSLKEIISDQYKKNKNDSKEKQDLEWLINIIGSLGSEYYFFGEILGCEI